MRRSIVLLVAILTGCMSHKPPPAGAPPSNPNQAANDKAYQKALESIAGHETEPAGKVFKNVKLPMLQNVPAKILLNVMNMGYAKALGVSCVHCHTAGDFSSDDKREKRAAREMALMARTINEDLKKMENLEGKPEERFANCSTCHRGHVNPHEGEQSPSERAALDDYLDSQYQG